MSTGINPWAYAFDPPSDDAWRRLPDEGAHNDLIQAARWYYDVDVTQARETALIAAPGTQALIQWLARLRPSGRVGVVSPTYGEHALVWRRAGHRVDLLNIPEDGLDDCAVIIVVNPNNPDGRVWAVDRLVALGEALSARGGWLIVDEAFADVTPECSIIGRHDHSGVIVLRSFGKFFGLAGLRLGFAAASRLVCAKLSEALGPWHISGPALAIGRQALSDTRWIADTRARLKDSAVRLEAILGAAGLVPVGGTDLFRLARVPRVARVPQASSVFAALAQAGILVRRFDDHGDWLRFGLPGAPGQWSRFEKALHAALSS